MGRTITFFVPSNRRTKEGKLKGLDGFNEIIKANRANRQIGARQERQNVRNVEDYARLAMMENKFPPIEGKARVCIEIIEPNARRDVSNVLAATKYILDGITRPRGSKKTGAGLIRDDSPRWCECRACVSVQEGCAGALIKVTEIEDCEER